MRWLSCEPLLGQIDLKHDGWLLTTTESCTCDGGVYTRHHPYCGAEPGAIDWVVVGGESGPGARPMELDWARSLRDQCTSAGVPFFFKQWGEWCHSGQMPEDTWMRLDMAINLGQEQHPEPHRVGKKRSGRLLDGRTWDEYPDL